MDATIVVDMQVGLLAGPPKHDLDTVVARLNRLTAAARASGGAAIFVRHCGPPGEDFAPGSPSWEFLPALRREAGDLVVEKTLNDPFAGTTLKATLDRLAPDRVLVGGWATEFCVDATVRSLVSNGYAVGVAADAHTLADRPHLPAPAVIAHHNWVWANLLTRAALVVAPTAALIGAG